MTANEIKKLKELKKKERAEKRREKEFWKMVEERREEIKMRLGFCEARDKIYASESAHDSWSGPTGVQGM